MIPAKLSASFISLSLLFCASCSETDVGAVAAIAAAAPLPTGPSLPGAGTPKIQLCTGKPDLALQVQTFKTLPGWVVVSEPVKNVGGATWTSNVAQIAMATTTNTGASVKMRAKVISPVGAPIVRDDFGSISVAESATMTGALAVTGLLRAGHDTAQWGECQATLTFTSKLVFDPDILNDSNTANDDCLAKNNQRSDVFKYMVACPW
jgi:hypothetical protein